MTVTIHNVTRNVRSADRTIEGALIRLSADGETATVLLRGTGRLLRCPSAWLSPWKGRPVKLVRGLCRADVNELIEGSMEFCQDAIEELFGRQTSDERDVRATYHHNDVGFRADDAKRGSELALKPAWNEADLAGARGILSVYSGTQLFDIASEFLSERECVEATSPGLRFTSEGKAPSPETVSALAECFALLASLDASPALSVAA